MTGTGQLAVLLAAASGVALTGRGSAAAARLRAARRRSEGSAAVEHGPLGHLDHVWPLGQLGQRARLGQSGQHEQLARSMPQPPGWLPRSCAVAAGGAVLTGHGVCAAILLVAASATWLPGRRAADVRRRAERSAAHDLPRIADLLAACLEAGLPVADAAAVVGSTVAGPLATDLRRAGAALQAGADPLVVWSISAPDGGGGWARLGAALEQGATSGAPLAGLLRALADDERDQARWAADAAAQRAGVRAIGPLVVCFLPAFVLVGVVPVVAGIAGRVVGGLG